MSAPAPRSAPATPARGPQPPPRAAGPRPISWPKQAHIIFTKDLMIELRTGEVVSTSAFFGFVPLSGAVIASVLAITFAYAVASELAKRRLTIP